MKVFEKDNDFHIQFVQRKNSDTGGWDTRRTRQLCNYTNLPSSFKLVTETDTDTIKSPVRTVCHVLWHMTAWVDNRSTRIFLHQTSMTSVPEETLKQDKNVTQIYSIYLKLECLQHSWWKENSATGWHICQKSSEALHFATRGLETWRQSFSAWVYSHTKILNATENNLNVFICKTWKIHPIASVILSMIKKNLNSNFRKEEN